MLLLDKPRDKDLHSLADFAELLCLLNPDRTCSRETISDQIRDVGDGRIEDVELDDCFAHLAWRASAFEEHYPFTLNAERVITAPDDLSSPKRLYVLLLICSNLPFFDKRDGSLTDVFERISLLALKGIFPTTATVRAFGKNSSEYKGAKYERINQLAQDLGGAGGCKPDTFRLKDTGDGGIDLVAWLQLDEFEKRNMPTALAQCACSRNDWSGKQTEISQTRLGSYIHASSPWMEILFMPHSFRDNHGCWAVLGDIGMTIILDRLRIIKQIGTNIDWAAINPPKLFHDFLKERLDLV